ncbi:MAG: hypothetical protein E6767_16030 [Dysgonomonas sp.]|nr:hypothetical protein [Dysgonomonas sp.]
MENLIKKLQEEVGLTETEAIKSLSIIKEYMDKEGMEVDWEKFFKGKTQEFLAKAKELFANVSTRTQPYTEKFADTVDDLMDKARKSAQDISQKAADFFDDKK